MANTKEDIIERYQSYKVNIDCKKVDRIIDTTVDYSEIIKKFDEIDELSKQISDGTVSALETYRDNILAFDNDLNKVVRVVKEKMEMKGVSAETLKKLDKISGVYGDTKETIEEITKIKRLQNKNSKELKDLQVKQNELLDKQKELRDKIADILSKDSNEIDQNEYFSLKKQQANLDKDYADYAEIIEEKQKKDSSYSERIASLKNNFSISKEAENFESKILDSFKDLAKDPEVSDNVMDLFKGFFAYNNGKYEITYPGWDKVKDAVSLFEDLKEKQKRVDDLSSELGMDSPSRNAITKTDEEEVKEVETPEETREAGTIDESEKDEPIKDETTKDESDKDDPSKDESEKDEQTKDESDKDDPSKNGSEKDEPEKDEPTNDETIENKGPAQKAKVQQPMTYAERTKQFAKKVGPVTVATAKNLDQKSYHGDAMPEFKGVEQTDPMYRNNVYMNPEEKQEFYEQMGYINSPSAGVDDEELKENAKDSFVRTLHDRYRTEPYLAGQMFNILYAKNIIDLDFNSKTLNKKERDELISQIATKLEKDPTVIAQLLAQSLSVTKRENVAKRAYKVISTRVANANELFKARTKGVRSFIDNIFGHEEMQNQYSQDASERGR